VLFRSTADDILASLTAQGVIMFENREALVRRLAEGLRLAFGVPGLTATAYLSDARAIVDRMLEDGR
jgi:hypothetical protein